MYIFKKTISIILLIFLAIVLQLNFFNNWSIFSVVPNTFVIVSIYVALLFDKSKLSYVINIIFGLLFDICFGRTIGTYALIGLVISILTPIAMNRMTIDTKIGMMIYTASICAIAETIMLIIGTIFYDTAINIYVLKTIVISPIYTAILTIFTHGYFSEYLKEQNSMFRIDRKY